MGFLRCLWLVSSLRVASLWPGSIVELSAEQEVDEIRAEYERTVAVFRDRYQIRSLEVLYARDPKKYPHGNPLASSEMVLASLNGIDHLSLVELAAKASESPEDLERYLKALEKLSPDQLTSYLLNWPDLAIYPLEVSDDVTGNALVVKDWWARLSERKRTALIAYGSGMVGNLEGIPYEDRSRANVLVLESALSNSRLAHEMTHETKEKLRHIKQVLEEAEEGIPRYLTSLDLSNLKPENGDGYGYNDVLASISLGDIDEADKVSVVVPGMKNNASSMRDLSMAGTNIYREQEDALEEHGESNKKHAVELWIGYETPPGPMAQVPRPGKRVTRLDLAEEGGKKLAAHIDGMNVTKSNHAAGSGDYSDPQISMIAHSYGTTTTGQAAQHAETTVDSIVMYGSAGISDEAVADANGDGWNVDRDSEGRQKIYYTESGEDWTVWMGRDFGDRQDPSTIEDAQRFQSTEGISADGQYYEDVDTHDFVSKRGEQGYADGKTTSLYYGARAALGYEEDVDKRFYEPWGIVKQDGGGGGVFRVDPDSLKGGRVPEETMKNVRELQDIPESDLVGGDESD